MIVIMGSVGSGKSGQGRLLADRLGCAYISTGDMSRRDRDKKAQVQVRNGKLVDDRHIIAMLEQELAGVHSESKELVLDGAPRTIPQAKWLIKKIRAGEVKLTAVIYLKVSKAEVVKRLGLRGRTDDDRQVLQQRLREFEKKTLPVVNYLRLQGIRVDDVEGEGTIEQVSHRINQVLHL